MAHPAQITVIECAQVRNAIFQHRNPLNPHAKGKTLIFLGVIATIRQHPWIDHAGTKDFQLVITRPDLQPAAITGTADIDLC